MKERVLILVVFVLMYTACSEQAVVSNFDATGSFVDLATPQSLLAAMHRVSVAGETHLLGKDYSESLGCGKVEVAGDAAKFSPQCNAGAITLANTAYAIYSFELPDYDDLAQLTLVWDAAPASTELYIGLGDFDGDRWKWFQPANSTILSFTQLEPYFSETGIFLAAVVIAGTDVARLASLRLGEETEVPEAMLAADVLSGAVRLTVQFDASGSTDPGTGITLYEWDWDGDGTYDENTGATAAASHVFETAANYTVGLRVTGSGGTTATDSVVIVAGDTAGWQTMTIPPSTCRTGHMLWDVAGHPAVIYLDGYSVVYRRASDARGETWGDSVVVETMEDHAYYGSVVAMVDDVPAAAWFRLTETSFPSNIELHFSMSQDATGAAWQTPVVAVEGLYYNDAGSLGLVEAAGYPALGYIQDGFPRFMRAVDARGAAWGAAATLSESAVHGMSGLALVDGRPACALVDLSTEPYGCELRYVIADDAAGASFAAPVVAVPRQFGEIGRMRVADINGQPGIVYSEMSYVIGSDSAGTSWSSPVEIATGGGTSYILDLTEVAGHPAVVCAEWYPYSYGDIYYVRAGDRTGAVWPAAQLVEHFEWTSSEMPFSVVGVGMLDGLQAVYYGGYVEPLTLAVYK